jgi:hypothetical protein
MVPDLAGFAGWSNAPFAWLHQFKRLRIRYERRADIHQGLLELARSLLALMPAACVQQAPPLSSGSAFIRVPMPSPRPSASARVRSTAAPALYGAAGLAGCRGARRRSGPARRTTRGGRRAAGPRSSRSTPAAGRGGRYPSTNSRRRPGRQRLLRPQQPVQGAFPKMREGTRRVVLAAVDEQRAAAADSRQALAALLDVPATFGSDIRTISLMAASCSSPRRARCSYAVLVRPGGGRNLLPKVSTLLSPQPRARQADTRSKPFTPFHPLRRELDEPASPSSPTPDRLFRNDCRNY